MPAIPPFVLRKLYVKGSLRKEAGGFSLELRNSIAPGTITAIAGLELDYQVVDTSRVSVAVPGGNVRPASEISEQAPLHFPIWFGVRLSVSGEELAEGPHQLTIRVVVKEVGPLDIPIFDSAG
jgi:hydroxymethylglutaryl-CoA reductase (NADPH)